MSSEDKYIYDFDIEELQEIERVFEDKATDVSHEYAEMTNKLANKIHDENMKNKALYDLERRHTRFMHISTKAEKIKKLLQRRRIKNSESDKDAGRKIK